MGDANRRTQSGPIPLLGWPSVKNTQGKPWAWQWVAGDAAALFRGSAAVAVHPKLGATSPSEPEAMAPVSEVQFPWIAQKTASGVAGHPRESAALPSKPATAWRRASRAEIASMKGGSPTALLP